MESIITPKHHSHIGELTMRQYPRATRITLISENSAKRSFRAVDVNAFTSWVEFTLELLRTVWKGEIKFNQQSVWSLFPTYECSSFFSFFLGCVGCDIVSAQRCPPSNATTIHMWILFALHPSRTVTQSEHKLTCFVLMDSISLIGFLHSL